MKIFSKRRWPFIALIAIATLLVVAGSAVVLHKTSDTAFCVS